MHVPGFGAVPETPFHKIESEFLNQAYYLGCRIPRSWLAKLLEAIYQLVKATTDKDLLHFSLRRRP